MSTMSTMLNVLREMKYCNSNINTNTIFYNTMDYNNTILILINNNNVCNIIVIYNKYNIDAPLMQWPINDNAINKYKYKLYTAMQCNAMQYCNINILVIQYTIFYYYVM